ncbi:MAG: hypothetical protein VX392_03390, partial [Verrucomicrobiota bacterium]|nr:hypothetical protein [Verrucomicrobiota bacterium]
RDFRGLQNWARRSDGRLTMKSQLITIVATVLVVECGESQPPEPPTAKAPPSWLKIHAAAHLGLTTNISPLLPKNSPSPNPLLMN